MIDLGLPWLIFILWQYFPQCNIGPWFTIVYMYIEIIFAIVWHWTILDHGWQCLIFILRQYLSQCQIGTWFTIVDNNYKPKGFILNNRINIINLINNIFHVETIFVTMWPCSLVDHDWFSCGDSICHNTTFDHDWFSYWENLCHNVILDHGWPWL